MYSGLNPVECFAWENYDFFPKLISNPKTQSSYAHIRGPKFFSKEILEHAKQLTLLGLGESIERMEYGSIANHKTAYADKFGPSSKDNTIARYAFFNMKDKNILDKFLKGDCVGLIVDSNYEDNKKEYFLCETCLMHQYGLHRTKDKIRDICKSGKNPAGGLKTCFWTSKSKNSTYNAGGTQINSNLNNLGNQDSKLCPPGDVTHDPLQNPKSSNNAGANLGSVDYNGNNNYDSNFINAPQFQQKQYPVRMGGFASRQELITSLLFFGYISNNSI